MSIIILDFIAILALVTAVEISRCEMNFSSVQHAQTV